MQQNKANDFNINNLGGGTELLAIISGALSAISSGELVQVIEVNTSGLAPVGFVSVRPLVYKIDGDNQNVERAVIHNVPYFRLQGGTNAIVCDPQVGDIGFCGICSRDISLAKRVRSYAPPNMKRMCDISDAVFFGGWSAQAPQQYVYFDGSEIKIKANAKVTIDAPLTATTGNLAVNGTINSTGNITGNGISFNTHTHSGVQTGPSNTGGPQ